MDRNRRLRCEIFDPDPFNSLMAARLQMSGAIEMMTIEKKIEAAFSHRNVPDVCVTLGETLTPEIGDALQFQHRRWTDISWRDWDSYPDAFFSLNPNAFQYYLPSLLVGVLQHEHQNFVALHSLVGVLDRSPEPAFWDTFLTSRFLGLYVCEIEVIQEWFVILAERVTFFSDETILRCIETLELIRQAAGRVGTPCPPKR